MHKCCIRSHVHAFRCQSVDLARTITANHMRHSAITNTTNSNQTTLGTVHGWGTHGCGVEGYDAPFAVAMVIEGLCFWALLAQLWATRGWANAIAGCPCICGRQGPIVIRARRGQVSVRRMASMVWGVEACRRVAQTIESNSDQLGRFCTWVCAHSELWAELAATLQRAIAPTEDIQKSAERTFQFSRHGSR